MPISSALLEAVRIQYNRDFLNESQSHNEEIAAISDDSVNKPQLEIFELNSDGEYVPSKMIVAECLIQLAWSGDKDPESASESEEVSSGTTSSHGHPEQSMFPWYEEMNESLHLNELFQLASATPTPKRTSQPEFRPVIKRRRLVL